MHSGYYKRRHMRQAYPDARNRMPLKRSALLDISQIKQTRLSTRSGLSWLQGADCERKDVGSHPNRFIDEDFQIGLTRSYGDLSLQLPILIGSSLIGIRADFKPILGKRIRTAIPGSQDQSKEYNESRLCERDPASCGDGDGFLLSLRDIDDISFYQHIQIRTLALKRAIPRMIDDCTIIRKPIGMGNADHVLTRFYHMNRAQDAPLRSPLPTTR